MKVTQKIFVAWKKGYGDEPHSLSIYGNDLSKYFPEEIPVGFQEVELDIPPVPTDAEFINQQIYALRLEQGKHQAEITNIERRIQELQAIEFKPDPNLDLRSIHDDDKI
jgi:hypothetical protein